ncbi:MAG: GNAT family protein [Chloroflexota bacterium]
MSASEAKQGPPVDLFRGEHVRLTMEEPACLGKAFSRWERDSEYTRLLNTSGGPLWSQVKFKEWFEKDAEKEEPQEILFGIRLRAVERRRRAEQEVPSRSEVPEDVLIGYVCLWGLEWNHGEACVSIGIGERQYWGSGYGTQAMRLTLRYAFTELNLARVSLGVFDYNARAIRSYQKAGFSIEGRERQRLRRDGCRADLVIMGALRHEWHE